MRREMADLRQALKDWRRATAKRLQQPAFCVFPDKVLDAIVAARPSSNAQLASVRGLGPAKVAKFGKDVISIVARHGGALAPVCSGALSPGFRGGIRATQSKPSGCAAPPEWREQRGEFALQLYHTREGGEFIHSS